MTSGYFSITHFILLILLTLHLALFFLSFSLIQNIFGHFFHSPLFFFFPIPPPPTSIPPLLPPPLNYMIFLDLQPAHLSPVYSRSTWCIGVIYDDLLPEVFRTFVSEYCL